MSLLKIIKECNQENIEIFHSLTSSGVSLPIGHNLIVFGVGIDQSYEEQVKALLHEIVHYFPDYHGKSTGEKRDEKIEAEIESLAKKIYEERPIIKRYIEKQLEAAKRRQGYLLLK